MHGYHSCLYFEYSCFFNDDISGMTLLGEWLTIIVPEFVLLSLIRHIMTNQWVAIMTQFSLITAQLSQEHFTTLLKETLNKQKENQSLSENSVEKCAQIFALKAFFFLTRQLGRCHATRNRRGSVLPHDTANTPPSHNLAYTSQPTVFPSVSSARKQSR